MDWKGRTHCPEKNVTNQNTQPHTPKKGPASLPRSQMQDTHRIWLTWPLKQQTHTPLKLLFVCSTLKVERPASTQPIISCKLCLPYNPTFLGGLLDRWKETRENIFNKVQKKTTYFSRGMCSKEPDVGIVPHKLLLETSLEKEKESLND